MIKSIQYIFGLFPQAENWFPCAPVVWASVPRALEVSLVTDARLGICGRATSTLGHGACVTMKVDESIKK